MRVIAVFDAIYCRIKTRIGLASIVCFVSLIGSWLAASSQQTVPSGDPAAWGSDHVDKQIPMYMTGDECLFCHRTDIGATLQSEPHNVSMRVVQMASPSMKKLLDSVDTKGFGGEATYILGGDRQRRFLKPNGSYGQFAIHAAKWTPGEDGVLPDADGEWDNDLFAKRCAGCHATAVETEYEAFSAASLDCFVCHGDTPMGHQNTPEIAIFAKKREQEPLVEMSICGQCHLRGGASRSSGLPYPNQFVPGDNLFRDFEVDLSDVHLASMNPGDRHVYENVRDVVLRERLELTCTTCHDLHGQSTRRHRALKRLQRGAYCAICHEDAEDYTQFLHYEVRSDLCQY